MDKDDVKRYYEKIINSKYFTHSDINKKLLSYLIEATLNKVIPKEITIAIDVFNYRVGDTKDANVRVYVSKLRKKLDLYYKYEGKKDSIRFSIPRGSYSIEFNSKKIESVKVSRLFSRAIEVIIITLVVVGMLFLTKEKSKYNRLLKTEFWAGLTTNNIKTTIVAGNFFVFANMNMTGKEGEHYILRLSNVNSQEELRDYVFATDSLDLEDISSLQSVTYLQRDALYSMPYIIPLLDRNDIDYDISLTEDFNWDLFKNNIIYSGVFKNMRSLSFLHEQLNVDFILEEERIDFHTSDSILSFYAWSDDFYHIDYVLISKIPGPNNNTIYFFVSVFDIGCVEAVKHFTNFDFVNNFNKNTTNEEKYFTALYKVEGVEYSAVSFNMVAYKGYNDFTLNLLEER